MFDRLEILQMAQGMARHASARQSAVAENIANVNTPGFKQRDIASFSDLYRDGASFGLSATRPGHLGGTTAFAPTPAEIVRGASEDPSGNSVSLETEIVKAAELRQQHDMALTIYQSAMTVLRASLGRR